MLTMRTFFCDKNISINTQKTIMKLAIEIKNEKGK